MGKGKLESGAFTRKSIGQSRRSLKKLDRSGFRVGEIGESNAERLIQFEVDELGNDHIIRDAANVLHTKATRRAVFSAIRGRFGKNAQAIWLCRDKSWCEQRYGYPGQEADQIKIPKGAIVISDLGSDGQLWLMKKQKVQYYGDVRMV